MSEIDLWLWHKAGEVPEHEKWKWQWELWDPVMDQVFNGQSAIEEIACPVCGRKDLYTYFMAFHILRSTTGGRRVYVGDRWWGCYGCRIQKRDYGLLPSWLKDEDIVWASEKAREKAEQDWVERQTRLKDEEGVAE